MFQSPPPQYPELRKRHHKKKPRKPVNRNDLRRHFRKIVHVVLFTIYLRKFTSRVVAYRKIMFNQYMNESNDFKEETNKIKKILIEGCKHLFVDMIKK